MADGVWRMNDDGTFEVSEPYATMLEEARKVTTDAWTDALIGYLEERSPYTAERLNAELVRRNMENRGADQKLPLFESLVLEALSGDL